MSDLRRSLRKRFMPDYFGSSLQTSGYSSSNKRIKGSKSTTDEPTLLSFPQNVIETIFLYLDVGTLEIMCKTCSYFDQMINGKYITSINFPFSEDFIKEIADTDSVEKKPLLKLICKKPRDVMNVYQNQNSSYLSQASVHQIIVETPSRAMNYVVISQMSLLSLHQLRELDLVPECLKNVVSSPRLVNEKVISKYTWFDCDLILQISKMGSLKCVTRLDILVNEAISAVIVENTLNQFPSLIELGLHVLTNSLGRLDYFNTYLPRLEAIVSASKAPVLKVTFVAETRKFIPKVFKNSFIEKLVVTGPCTSMVFPVMESLKVVDVNLDSSTPNICNYWRSKNGDRDVHRAGLCCVNVGAVYENCPRIEKFMGVEIGSVGQNQTFNQWNNRVKKLFYNDYICKGGDLDQKTWAQSRWFSKRKELPTGIGRDRPTVCVIS